MKHTINRRGLSLLLAALIAAGVLWSSSLGGAPAARAGAALADQGVLKPTGLTVEQQQRPLAVERAAPAFGWVVNDRDAGSLQSAYQLRVAASAEQLAAGSGLTWDSGMVMSSASANVAYGGPALAAAQRYWWSVRTWDAASNVSPWADPASFGTAVKTDWRGVPIWGPPPPVTWASYTLDADFTVTAAAVGIKFRASGGNSFMWQIRGDSANTLRPHVQVNGAYSLLKSVALPMTIGLNTRHRVRIEASGATIRTYIDGALVDTTTDARNPSGSIGFRTGNSESGTFDNVVVTGSAGATLYTNSFSAASGDFPCGAVGGGVLSVGTAKDCAYSIPGQATSDNWAFLRREFTVQDKPIAWATAYVTGRSTEPARQYVYRFSLNGAIVGVGPSRARVDSAMTMYSAYDVTGLLLRGAANALGALAYSTADKRFLAQLVIAYADGTRDLIATDGAWRTLPGELAIPGAGSIGSNSPTYFAAPVENIDARRYPFGFDAPGFDDSGWSAPAARPSIAPAALFGTPMPPLELRLRAPAQIVQVAAGHYLLDFGHTVVGGLQLRLSGSGGETVDIRLGEELTPDGVAGLSPGDSVRYQLRATNVYRDIWTLRPGAQTLQLWGYRVFRYAQLIGPPAMQLTPANVAAAALVYPYAPDASAFTSSSAALNQVYEFSRAGVRALNLDLHLDSPTRERAPYEGDNLIHMLIQGYTDGDWASSKYSMEWLIENETWPMEWRLASILSAWEYWQATGDLSSAAAHYDQLRAFLPTGLLNADGLVQKAPGSSSQANADLVDWPAGERDGYVFTSVNTVINAWSYRAFMDMADIAAALGRDADAASYRTIAARMRDAINSRLWDAAAGAYYDGLPSATTHKAVHASVFALAFGVASPAQVGPAAAYVARGGSGNSNGIVCSVFCANFLIDGLFRAGRADDAVRLMTLPANVANRRSWLHMIALGAGAPMEAWDPALKSNTTFSHPWSGSPAYLVYRGIFGVRPLEPGYGRFQVRVQPGGLTTASGTVPTVRGPIALAFATAGGARLDLAVGVPANTSARVAVPRPSDGSTTLYVDQVAQPGAPEGNFLTVELGAGCHIVSTTGAASPPASVLAAVEECAAAH